MDSSSLGLRLETELFLLGPSPKALTIFLLDSGELSLLENVTSVYQSVCIQYVMMYESTAFCATSFSSWL